MTLDGYLPDPNEELLQWVKTDSQGFPFWHEKMCIRDRATVSCTGSVKAEILC